MVREIWLVRHGETEWSRIGKHTGRSDVPLTDEGERQARGLASPLSRHEFAQVWTSPLRRARRTAELAGFGARAQVMGELVEWDYGAYEQRLTSDVRREVPGWTVWTHPVPGGETIDDLARRARAALAALEAGPGGDVLVFAHGHLLRVLAMCWADLPPAAGGLFSFGPAHLSVLGWETERRVVRCWNVPVGELAAPGPHRMP